MYALRTILNRITLCLKLIALWHQILIVAIIDLRWSVWSLGDQSRGCATLVKSVKSTKSTKSSIPFSIYSKTFPPWYFWHWPYTPIGVGPDHVIKGANQRTLAAGNGERVGVDGWDRQKKVCKFWSPFDATSVLLCLSTVPKVSKVPKVPSLSVRSTKSTIVWILTFWYFW